MDDKSGPKIEIADNGLSASLILPKDFDRSLLTPSFCEPLLKRAGVEPVAFDTEVIEACIESVNKAPQGRFESIIAEATPAIPGIDAYIDWFIEKPGKCQADRAVQLSGRIDEAEPSAATDHDSVSFYSQSVFTVVKVGDVLGKVYPEVPGTEGTDVRGKALPARTAKPLELKYDETIGIDEDNNLIAKADGVLMRDRKSARVSDTIEVDQSVDFSTGNIDFPGHVLVHHGVKDCFTVVARDNIEVRGLIEAANLIAGQDLRAAGGFAGREQGTAKVEGSLYAKYLDAVQAYVGTDLCVEREVINCTNTVLGNINSPRGSIIGGHTKVTGTVELLDLGASAQPITELCVGVLPLLDPLIDELVLFVQELTEERARLIDEQEMITANSGSRIAPSHQTKLDELQTALGKLQLQLDRAEPALEQIQERADTLRKIDIKINRKLHPNVVLITGDYRYRISNEIKGPIHITANKRGQLQYQQGENKPRLLSTEAELRTAA